MIRTSMILVLLASVLGASDPKIGSGDTIVFMGDSITQQGAQSPSGYVRLVISGLEANSISAKAIPAGVSGNKSNQMRARLGGELDKKPTWMTLSCGVNDVWHGEKGVSLEKYQENITAILDRAHAAGVKVMILTATMIKENPSHGLNASLKPYNDFLRTIAVSRGLPLADLNADMTAIIMAASAEERKSNLLTYDGVHMNAAGNRMMAVGVLRAFGIGESGIAKATEAWQDIPKAVQLSAKAAITMRQYDRLRDIAATQGRSVDRIVDQMLEQALAGFFAADTAK